MAVVQPKKIYRYQGFNPRTVEALCNDELFFSDPTSYKMSIHHDWLGVVVTWQADSTIDAKT